MPHEGGTRRRTPYPLIRHDKSLPERHVFWSARVARLPSESQNRPHVAIPDLSTHPQCRHDRFLRAGSFGAGLRLVLQLLDDDTRMLGLRAS